MMAHVEEFRTIGQRLRNWGRWGDDDERGTLNHITPDRLTSAASLVRAGRITSLSIPFGSDGPLMGPGRINPVHLMSVTNGVEVDRQGVTGAMHYSDDYVVMPLQAATQWDSLAHVFYDDLLYNGAPASTIGAGGAERNSIDKLVDGVAGRGVLLDVARSRGVDWLGAGDAIGPEELAAVASAQGVEIRSGDILLIRTGWWTRLTTERSRRTILAAEPGLGIDVAQWLYDHEIAAVAADNHAVEALPNDHPGTNYPLHLVLIRDMGMTLGEWFDLDRLAEDCAQDGVYEFFFCAPPLRITAAVGSPINPLAIK
jgi:kynurenine formamidase